MVKRIIVGTVFLVTIIVSMNNSYIAHAENGDYYMYTPAGLAILCNPGSDELPDSYDYSGDDNYAFIVVDIVTKRFNCHTFAWYYEGDVNAYLTENQFNIQDPSGYFDGVNTCYYALYAGEEIFTNEMASNLDYGDIVVFYRRNGDLLEPTHGSNQGYNLQESLTTYRHSAFVITHQNPNNTINDIRILSKWSIGPIVNSDLIHHPNYHAVANNPYGAIVEQGYIGDVIYVYRHNSNHVATHLLNYTETTHTYCCYYCGRGLETSPHTFVGQYSTDNISHWRVCTECNQVIANKHTTNSYNSNALVHSGVCNVCGASFQEPHDFVFYNNRYHCDKCGFSTLHPMYPNSADEEEVA